MHRLELELQVVWRHEWALALDFVRTIECHGRIVVPDGALLVAYVPSAKSYRVAFLLPPVGRKLDGIGKPRAGIGRPVAPFSLQPRCGTCPPQKPKRIAPEVRHE
jgi:hypothetical protein